MQSSLGVVGCTFDPYEGENQVPCESELDHPRDHDLRIETRQVLCQASYQLSALTHQTYEKLTYVNRMNLPTC